MSSATALALRVENARSSARATPESVRPGRSGVEKPMMPESRTTGTTGMSLRKRFGSSDRSIALMRPGLSLPDGDNSAIGTT